MSKTVIGIDLGTATTEAAVFLNGKPELIPNLEGNVITPSAVGLDEQGNIIVGEKARAQYILAPERTAIEIKRKMGTEERIFLGESGYTAVELSAFLLEYIRRSASAWLKEDINRAVISVPAYFDERQRQAVVEAGRQAGFTVERIINEPTAAALSYGYQHMEDENHILIYDLGGGTFDVTLLEMFGGVLEVKASSGCNHLGGKDFDEALMDWLKGRFESAKGISLDGNLNAMARLKDGAEECKRTLSSEGTAEVVIPFLAEKDGVPLGLYETVERSVFEKLIAGLLEETHGPVEVVLEDGGISIEELDLVLLVGGSTRIPLVRRDLAALVGQEPASGLHPDYSVAEGAAIQAAIISGALEGEDSLVMTDVNPYTLGVRCFDGFSDDVMSVIIPRNVTIPVTRSRTYYTAVDGQTVAEIQVYQGEMRQASSNHLLGTLMLEGIPAGPASKEGVEVAFSYNLNGMLQVSAKVVSTGKEAAARIDMLERGTEAHVDVSGWKEAELGPDYRSVIRRSEKYIEREKANSRDPEDEERIREMEELVYQLKKAIIENEQEEADHLEEALLDIMELEG